MSEVVEILSSKPRTPRQMKLFQLENPLTLRLGNAFFQGLPRSPGVYFFFGAEDRLLYIGQSSDLRARLGSYRHVTEGRHARRTLRLVARAVKIEWRECGSPEEAIAEERRLLLELRPPFNRAGTWQGEPWFLTIHEKAGARDLTLSHDETPGSIGPLPPGFRHTLPTLVRCLLRVENPAWRLNDYPCGIMGRTLAREFTLNSRSPGDLRLRLMQACTGVVDSLIAALDDILPAGSAAEKEFWRDEAERLQKASRSEQGQLPRPGLGRRVCDEDEVSPDWQESGRDDGIGHRS